LDAAVQCFWSGGYEATSIRDLAENMGISGASLYNAFGDKRSLYWQALSHYVARSFGDRAHHLETNLPPREALGSFFADVIERSLRDKERKGCMLVNSALEVAPHDPEFQRIIAGVLHQVEGFFHRCVEAGQANGTISGAYAPDDMARMLLSVLVGIRVLARTRPERKLLEGVVRPVFAMMGEHRSKAKRVTRATRKTKS
jgi:TetR/AcrR family transcriptional repressor of nem operon